MIRVLSVGRIRKGWAQQACADYSRRIQRFASLEVVEVPDSDPIAEARALRQKLAGGPVVACEPVGRAWTSPELAEFLGRHGSPTFLLGGPEGLGDGLGTEAHHRLAFGAVTLPHELARVVLLEQIYRGLTILRGHPYHR